VIHVVDTHALLWYLEASRRLSSTARQVLSGTSDSLIIPTIVLAEARYTIARQRTSVSWDFLLTAVENDGRFLVHQLDLDILKRISDQIEMHDAIICATALAYADASGDSVPVVTKDERIIDSGLVETVW